jgi:hypothetical protein
MDSRPTYVDLTAREIVRGFVVALLVRLGLVREDRNVEVVADRSAAIADRANG